MAARSKTKFLGELLILSRFHKYNPVFTTFAGGTYILYRDVPSAYGV